MMLQPEFEQFLIDIDRAVSKPLRGIQRHDLRINTPQNGRGRVDHLGFLISDDGAGILLSIGAGDRNPAQVPSASYLGVVYTPPTQLSVLDWRFSQKVEPVGMQVLRALEKVAAGHGVERIMTAPLLLESKVALAEKLGYRKYAGHIYVKAL